MEVSANTRCIELVQWPKDNIPISRAGNTPVVRAMGGAKRGGSFDNALKTSGYCAYILVS